MQQGDSVLRGLRLSHGHGGALLGRPPAELELAAALQRVFRVSKSFFLLES